MQLVVIEMTPAQRAALVARAQEACRQAELHRLSVVEVDPLTIDEVDWEKSIGCLVGSGCSSLVNGLLQKLQTIKADVPIALVLEPDLYFSEAVSVHKILGLTTISETDIAQIANFILDCERNASGKPAGLKERQVVGIAQLKGGVGATTLTAALGAIYAQAGLSTVLIDLDDVTPQLTDWSEVPNPMRQGIGEILRSGEITQEKLRELLHPVEGYAGRFMVLGQPLAYNEAFHLKAYVLDGAPGAHEFIGRILGLLGAQFDLVLIDLGKSWGISTLAALPWCSRVALVLDDDGIAVRRSLDALARLKQESGDSEEFNFARWSLVLNRYSRRKLLLSDVRDLVAQTGLLPSNVMLQTVRMSERGRRWGAPKSTFWDLADSRTKGDLIELANSLVPASLLEQGTMPKAGSWMSRLLRIS